MGHEADPAATCPTTCMNVHAQTRPVTGESDGGSGERLAAALASQLTGKNGVEIAVRGEGSIAICGVLSVRSGCSTEEEGDTLEGTVNCVV